uniref:murein hydrolase activator EnvC family protein n=1 Tax=Desertibaculum subflavum TaxID=2268458 RepID=UPI0013C46301
GPAPSAGPAPGPSSPAVAAPLDPPSPPPPSPPAAHPEPPPQVAALPPARAGSLLFTWPVKGRVVSGFGPKPGGQHNDGINIEVARGSPVRAAEAGTVVYAGNELKGYGNLVLIRHAGGWVTAYAHNDEILVRRGAQIGKGHLIAKSGASGGIGSPQVHFEIRKGREPVDPIRYLGTPETVSGAAGRGGLPGPG